MEAIGQVWCQMLICSGSACQERARLLAGLSQQLSSRTQAQMKVCTKGQAWMEFCLRP